MSDNIPFDIQTEIIRRLPIKPLIQFRLVSKQWKSLIDSFDFIANYHIRQPQPQHLIVSYSKINYSEGRYISIADDDTFPQHMFPLSVPESVKLHRKSTLVTSQGLLCLCCAFEHPEYSEHKKAVIWNPTIKKSVSIAVPDYKGDCIFSSYETVVGFGVCPSTCDPKLVKVASNCSSVGGGTIVEVFSLGVGAWRRLGVNLPHKSIVFTDNNVAIDRFIYWHAIEQIDSVDGAQWFNLIVSFDIVSEEFLEIRLPDSLAALDLENRLFISKMGESLVVVQTKTEDGKEIHSVWEMEDGVPKSFKKLFTIKTPDEFERVNVLGFRKSGEALIEMGNDLEVAAVFVYNANSENSTHVGITGKPYMGSVSSYMETLLLLDH